MKFLAVFLLIFITTNGLVPRAMSDWPGSWDNRIARQSLASWLLTGSWDNLSLIPEKSHEYEGYDGWYNNIAHQDLGAIDRPLLRRWPAAYADSTYLPAGSNRPNPLELSEKLLKGETGTKSKTGKNALIVFFGQQVVEEILDAQRPACPPEYFNIEVPQNHTYLKMPGHSKMPFLRTRYDQRTGYSPNNPRQQLNEITPYLDGGLFYGITKQWADQLRTYENGTIDPDGCLASSHDGLFPAYNTDRLPMANPPPPIYHSMFIKSHETAKVSRFFKLGNPRGNENSFLLTFGIMWFRWHNYIAKRIRSLKPEWSSEKVFNEARKWVIATQQKIVVYDWLPEWIFEDLPKYEKYDPGVDPQIDQFFQSAAFRFGHTLVVPGVYLRDYIRDGCKHKFDTWGHNTVRTCNSFWRPYEPIVKPVSNGSSEIIDIDRLLMGMAVQLCEEEDHKIVEDLRGNVFGPLEFPRRDLMALNIQRGRDHGIPDYNTVRQAYGLRRNTFKDFEHLSVKLNEFRQLYKNSIEDVDLWVGGILETKNNRPGELFRVIIKDQFRRIRDGDRFWFENKKNGLFTNNEIQRIKKITLYDIIMAVTKMDPNDLPKNVFNAPTDADNQLISTCRLMNSSCVSRNNETFSCYHLEPLSTNVINESCVQGISYDYFSRSEISYILTFTCIGTFIIGSIGAMYMLIKVKGKQIREVKIKANETTRKTFENDNSINYPLFVVDEWLGKKIPSRRVVLVLKKDKKVVEVMSQRGELLRVLDFTITKKKVEVYEIKDAPYVIIKSTHDYDLILLFESNFLRGEFLKMLDPFLTSSGLTRENISSFTWKSALKKVTTKTDRQLLLERFYRVVFAQTFKIKYSQKELLHVDESLEKEIADTELTLSEFAEALSMRAQDEFVRRMFTLVDKDKNGFISFREFVDLLVIFAEGDEDAKARLLFNMYDVNAVGHLKEENFIAMIKSFLATVGGNVEDDKLQTTVQGMLNQAGLNHKQELDFDDFLKLFGKEIKYLSDARLDFRGISSQNRQSYLKVARDTIAEIYVSRQEIQERFQGEIQSQPRDTSRVIDDNQAESIKSQHITRSKFAFVRYIELKSKQIFWMMLYTLVLWAIFIERAYYYTIEREHSGLRRIAGYGVTITRGAASAMMFTYSSLLITMCRNAITYLRDTVANNYFPFDASVEMHKYIAIWAFFFTVMHIVGHAFNFYHISTQTADDLTCLFRNFFHATHELPKFHYWCWQTITGFTGIVLTLIWALIYIFAQNVVRRNIYNWFWYTHNMYPLFFIFMVLHGTGRLIQPPFFYYFFLGPVILFTIDSVISISRKKVAIPVIRAEILPSNVTMLEFRKPENFQYKSGQWIRIASLGLNKNEYHPFTLSSSPDEDNLTVHIRAVGPWTTHIRRLYDNFNKGSSNSLLPKLYLDGPYGEGHQDWNQFEISVLIGGGIGVTPFASILKDVVFRSNQTRCKKVYFIWVSRTQKQFEWLVDIIRELEYKDKRNIISCHIFITQFFEKFDLRTTFLYICERHYQRISNRSLFTNLKAVTHFGRPHFKKFFYTVASLHEDVHSVGVFSCGPPSMTTSVDSACNEINAQTVQRFEHHYKNF
ncbi:dual oxidase 2-like [Tribolium madens]|uniref:dual oxidase 2-like n=1 Tax=Tribolium madens TaxID=41895 RepID=UPI001CF730CE|nr:dual oxidase 2-like [Tribolium madens]XP_044256243.1 dual oxidase 2-like [Tribolium madens]